jgi:hypothetical protein
MTSPPLFCCIKVYIDHTISASYTKSKKRDNDRMYKQIPYIG